MIAREPAPDALIIGAQKAGTSALHAALAQHPQIYASPVKEPECGGHALRPKLTPEQRAALLGDCTDDIGLLEQTVGESFQDWLSAAGRGSFAERTTGRPSGA